MKAASPPRLRSRLYDCVVTHTRLHPRRHQFEYRYFTFCLDLDEIDQISRQNLLFGHRLGHAFRFCAADFIFGRLPKFRAETGREKKQARKTTPAELKKRVIAYAHLQGVEPLILRVELVAHMRTLGYAFNPAAFYFCYDAKNQPVCAVVEVTNTYREKKTYMVGHRHPGRSELTHRQPKLFYVSPFVVLDADFSFRLIAPDDTLSLRIDSIERGEPQVLTVVSGVAHPLTQRALLLRFVRYPLLTLGIMAKIHYQALRLYLKGIPFIRKGRS